MIGLAIFSLVQILGIAFTFRKGYQFGMRRGMNRVYEELDD